jgi:hypothetical protein
VYAAHLTPSSVELPNKDPQRVRANAAADDADDDGEEEEEIGVDGERGTAEGDGKE